MEEQHILYCIMSMLPKKQQRPTSGLSGAPSSSPCLLPCSWSMLFGTQSSSFCTLPDHPIPLKPLFVCFCILFLFLTDLCKLVKGQDWEKTSNQARRKQLSKCLGENASFKITETFHAMKEFQNILHHCCKILSGKQIEMRRKISSMVSQNES